MEIYNGRLPDKSSTADLSGSLSLILKKNRIAGEDLQVSLLGKKGLFCNWPNCVRKWTFTEDLQVSLLGTIQRKSSQLSKLSLPTVGVSLLRLLLQLTIKT